MPDDGPPRAAVAALARASVAFAQRHPAGYDAMSVLRSGLPFADPATPAPLREAFAVPRATFARVPGDPGVVTEVAWAALHGLVTPARADRLPPGGAEGRLQVLVDRLAPLDDGRP